MILVVNAGSSNVKFAIYDVNNLELIYRQQFTNLAELYSWLDANATKYSISAIGHRVVHGGTKFLQPVILTPEIIKELQKLSSLAPLHQPHNLAAVEFLTQKYPAVPQVACFDTAFHATQNRLAKLFAIPPEYTASGIIRYGFHGLSYEYIATTLKHKLPNIASGKVIVAHLGNGCSMCAMSNAESVATSMGFSALDGLMMGSRCGSIDPGVLLYLLQEKKFSAEQLSDFLYNKCGLLGVSNISNDMQVLLASDSDEAQTAIELFCYKAASELGKLCASLHGLDAIVFTAGIGEHSPIIRQKICAWLDWLGITLNKNANEYGQEIISENTSIITVCVLATDEESVIVRHVKTLIYS